MQVDQVEGGAADETAGSVPELFGRQVARVPERTAVALVTDPGREDGVRRLSYAELDHEARAVAAHLRTRHQVGDRALLLYPMGLEFVIAFLGCLYAGMVVVPAPLPGRYRHHRERVRVIAVDAGASVVLTDRASHPAVQEWMGAEGLSAIEAVVTGGPELADPADSAAVPLGPDALALLQYTSGSTGHPKGVMLDHGNVLHNVESFVVASGWVAGTASGGWIPLYHDMGLSSQLLPALLRGGACYLMEPTAFVRRPLDWLRLIDRFDVRLSLAPNFAYDMCTRRIPDESLAGLDLSRWTFAGNGSEPVRPEVQAAFAKRFAAAGLREDGLSGCYGLAEATVFVSAAPRGASPVRELDAAALEQGRMQPAKPGLPMRSVVGCGPVKALDVRIVDPHTGAVLPSGRIGEIWLRGRSISRGYWNNPEATAAVFDARTTDAEQGFLRTGDLGALYDGELFPLGRIKELLIVHGRNLYPHDIEHELRLQHPELGNLGAVFMVPDEQVDGDDRLIVAHEVGNLPEAELQALAGAMAQTVAREFGVPVGAVLLMRPGTVRRTTSGKVQRSAMRESYLAGELRPRYPVAG